MVLKAVQAMLDTAIAQKVKAAKNVTTVKNAGVIKVREAEKKAKLATDKALTKAIAAEDGVANVIGKIDVMSSSLRKKADKLDAIKASVTK